MCLHSSIWKATEMCLHSSIWKATEMCLHSSIWKATAEMCLHSSIWKLQRCVFTRLSEKLQRCVLTRLSEKLYGCDYFITIFYLKSYISIVVWKLFYILVFEHLRNVNCVTIVLQSPIWKAIWMRLLYCILLSENLWRCDYCILLFEKL